MSSTAKLIDQIASSMADANRRITELAKPKKYTKGDLVEDFTEGRTYAREILDADGDVICHVIEDRDAEKLTPGNTAADALLTHLNR